MLVFVLLFLGYALVAFRSRRRRRRSSTGCRFEVTRAIQVLWIVSTTTIVLGLAGFGTFELVQGGSGGGQGPSAVFLPPGTRTRSTCR